jgi:hypothetical protein
VDRRNFLGSVIGTFVASQLPFIARPITVEKELTDERRARYQASLFDLSDSELKKYRLFVVAAGNIRFIAPAIKEIVREKRNGEMSIGFKAEDITLSVPMVMLGQGIMMPASPHVILANRYSCGVSMVPGDILKGHYILSMPILRPVDFSEG